MFELSRDAVNGFSTSWGLFYLMGFVLFLGVIIYAFWPSNKKRFDRAKKSILDKDDKS